MPYIPTLQDLAAENIFTTLKINYLFEISQTSKHAYNMVRTAIPLLSTQFYLKMSISSSPHVILSCDNGWEDRQRVQIEFQRDSTSPDNSRIIKGLDFCWKTDDSNRYLCQTSSFSIPEVLMFFQNVLELFKADLEEIHIETDQIAYLPAIQEVELFRKSEKVIIGKGILSHEDMRRVLEGFKARNLVICCDTEPNFKLERTSSPSLEIEADGWRPGAFLNKNLQIQMARMKKHGATETGINMFIFQWTLSSYQGGLYLEFFKATDDSQPSKCPWGDWNIEEVTMGFANFITHQESDDDRYSFLIKRNADQCIIEAEFSKTSCIIRN